MKLVKMLSLCCLLLVSTYGIAQPLLTFNSPTEQARYESLTKELRCPKCQNQDLADSQAGIAADLRKQIYRMIQEGKSDDDIVNYMVARYGDFVLYRPKYSMATSLLWLGPVGFLGVGLLIFIGVILRNKKRSAGGKS